MVVDQINIALRWPLCGAYQSGWMDTASGTDWTEWLCGEM